MWVLVVLGVVWCREVLDECCVRAYVCDRDEDDDDDNDDVDDDYGVGDDSDVDDEIWRG